MTSAKTRRVPVPSVRPSSEKLCAVSEANSLAIAQVAVVRIRKGPVGVGLRAVAGIDPRQLMIWRAESRLQHERVDQREHRRVGADPERQHERGDDGEGAVPEEEADAESKVLKERGHAGVYVEDRVPGSGSEFQAPHVRVPRFLVR